MGIKGIMSEVDARGALQAQTTRVDISKGFENALIQLKLNLKGFSISSSFSQLLSVLFHQ